MKLMRVWALGPLFAALGMAQQIAPADGVGSALAQPQSAVTLQVLVSDGQGNPLSGQSVLFIAPSSGPSGEFTAGAGDSQSRVATGADGLATVQFHTNNLPGPFMVSAWVEGTAAVTELAITNTLAPAPALDAATALAAVQNQLAPAASAIVYGPFLLDAGTVLTESSGPKPYSVTLQSQTVFLWIDDNPLATFDHPVRWVMLDASNATPTVTPVTAAWAPYITPAGGTPGYGLVGPYYRLPDGAILPASPSAAAAVKTEAKARPRGDGSNTMACAIIVYGPDSTAFENSAAQMRDVFSNTLNIPDANILEDTTPGTLYGTNHQASTPTRMHNLFAQAMSKGCTKLYFYFAGHGYNGGFCLAKEPTDTSTADYSYYDYTNLANDIAGTKIPAACVVLQACHTASAIAPLQGHGFSGEIATAADINGLAYHNPVPGFREAFWTHSLTIAWMVFGPNYSLSTVAQATIDTEKKVNDFTTGYILPGNPRVATIDANGGQANAPEVVIEDLNDSAQNPVSFALPIPAGFPAGGGNAQIFIDDISVAQDPNAVSAGSESDLHRTNVTLKAGASGATFTVKGLKEGDTTYHVTFTDQDQKTYTATGTIRVGTGYSVAPSPVGIHVGGMATVHVTRGPELAKQAGAVTLTIKAADGNSAAVAAPGSTQVTFPPGQTSVDVTIKGLKPGMATMSVGDGKATKTFQVNVDAVSLDHSSLQMKVGDTQVVMLERQGFNVPNTQIPQVAITTNGSAATITPSTFPLPYSTMSFPVTVNARANGTTTFTFVDTLEGFTLTLPVTVGTGTTPTSSPCPTDGTMFLNIQLLSDPFKSASFVNMPMTAMLGFTMSNGQLGLSSTIPQLPSGSGSIDATCKSTIKTVSQMPIAGFSNVHVQYGIAFQPPAYNTVTMQIQVGTDNTLNNESLPVAYTANGTIGK